MLKNDSSSEFTFTTKSSTANPKNPTKLLTVGTEKSRQAPRRIFMARYLARRLPHNFNFIIHRKNSTSRTLRASKEIKSIKGTDCYIH